MPPLRPARAPVARAARALVVAVVVGALAVATAQGSPWAGTWRGAIDPGPRELALTLHLADGPDGLRGTLDVPAQDAHDLPLDVTLLDTDTIRFVAPDLPAAPTFTARRRDGVLEGDLRQGTARLPFRLERTPAADADPAPPFAPGVAGPAAGQAAAPATPRAYAELEVVVPGPAGPLTGALTVPRGLGPHPVAVLLSTVGPQDRDGTLDGTPVLRTLADALTRDGVATLRLDDRGVGGSAGTYAEAGLDGLTADALAVLAWLPRRSDVAADHVALVGHGWGGIVAARATLAARAPARRADLAGDAAPNLAPVVPAATVLLATPAVDGRTALLDRGRPPLGDGTAPGATAAYAAYLRDLHAAFTAGDGAAATLVARAYATARLEARPAGTLPASEAERDRIVAAVVRDATAATARDVLLADPAATLEALPGPALGVYLAQDARVPADRNGAALRAAWRPPAGDAPQGVRTVVVLAGIDHTLRAGDGRGAPDDGGGTAAERVVREVTGFLATHAFPR